MSARAHDALVLRGIELDHQSALTGTLFVSFSASLARFEVDPVSASVR
jgi:hypothetical protein